LQTSLKSLKVLPTFLYAEEEDTFVFEELTVPEIVQDHELSVEEEALLFDSEDQELPELELIPYEPDEYAVEREEMEREAATWDSAHTEHPSIMYTDPAPTSLVERLRPLQDGYNMRMHTFNNLVITGESVVHADYAIANADAALTAHVQQTMRNNRPIELIDDTE
jgi:hypothetical protein